MKENENFYPKVIIPKSIEDAFVPPSEPIDTSLSLFSFVKERLIFGLIAIILIVIGIGISNGVPTVVGVIMLFFQCVAINSYVFQKRIHKESYQEYNKYTSSRLLPAKLYYFVKDGKTNTFYRDLYYVDKLDKCLKYTPAPVITKNSCKRGISELGFKKHLLNYLNIEFADIQYEVNLGSKTYYPDIVIKTRVGSNTAYIDIEIDEPYSFDSQLIHYIGRDNFRNDCFEKNGWVVIRFAEEQVLMFPDECSELVGSVSKHLYSGGVEKILNYESIRIPQWTCGESLQMMKNNYRDNYWPQAKEIKIL